MKGRSTPLVVAKTSRKEILVAIAIILAVVAMLIFGLLRLTSSAVGSNLTGKITARTFIPHEPETQITIGTNGIAQANNAGSYTLSVQTPDGKEYTVWVDQTVYQAKRVGDEFTFPRPVPTTPR